MYRILLAEDEPEVLEAVTEIVDWEAHFFHPPVGCRDGQEAVAMLERGFAPDVIITDIRMPFVDGLELTRYAGEHCPETIVVILSGHDEFRYAQQAVQLQVFDYLLKPVIPSAMGDLLERLRGELDARARDSGRDAMPILQSHFLNRLLGGRMDAAAVAEGLARFGLVLPGERQLVMVVDFDRTGADDLGAADLELMRYGLHNIAQELAEAEGALAFQGQDGAVRVLAGGETAEDCRARAENLARVLVRTAEDCLKLTVSAGIGEPVDGPARLYRSHAQAQEALEYRFFYGESSVLLLRDIQTRQGEAVDFAPVHAAFAAALRDLDEAAAREAVARLFDGLKRSHVPFARCAGSCQRMIAGLLSLVSRFGGDGGMERVERAWVEMDFYAATTLTRLEEIMLSLCREVFGLFEPSQTDSAAALAIKAEGYIRENLGNPELSLQAVTEHLSISVSYFSAIFKAHTGSTFVEYLTRLRMDRARQILARTDRRTYEAAAEVGFSDPHYFSVAFKRVTGMSPREYREYARNRDEA